MAKTPLDVRPQSRSCISAVFDVVFCRRFVTLFWPKKVKAAKLEEIHAKMVIKEAGDANIPKKPRLSANGKPTGNGATPSNPPARTNGKSYR
jgi:chromodomain-helicase-DNA-binding protein 1